MYPKIFLNALLIIFLVLFQIAFVSGLPAPFYHLNLILVSLIFVLGLYNNLNLAMWWAFGLGLLLDIISFNIFGIYLFSLFLSLLAAYFIFFNILTDRSAYSFSALILATTFFYEMIFNLLIYLVKIIREENAVLFITGGEFWHNLAGQLILNSVFILILFYLANFMSKRLRPVFLIKNK